MDPNQQYLKPKRFKVMLFGDDYVGKDCFQRRMLCGSFRKTAPTEKLSSACFSLKDGSLTRVLIFHPLSASRLELSRRVLAHSDGIFLCFDLTNRETFDHLEFLLKQIHDHGSQDAVVMLIGTKLDLVQENPASRQVNEQEARDFAKIHGLVYKETSAKNGQNVKEAFLEMGELINDEQEKSKRGDIILEKTSVKSDRCFFC